MGLAITPINMALIRPKFDTKSDEILAKFWENFHLDFS